MTIETGVNRMSTLCSLLAAALLLGGLAATARAQDPAAASASVGAAAEADLGVLLDAIRANRKALVAVNLALSDEEAAKFWPVYDRYARELYATGDRLAAVIQEYTASYRTLSGEAALKLVDEYLAVEADRVKVRQAYRPEFAEVLPGRTVARLYQIENKIDAVIKYDLAADIPVIDEEAGAPAE
jgi:hypothetical protein